MHSPSVLGGFTSWVENLARDQTDKLVATAVREGLTGDEAMDAVQEAFTTFLTLPQARALAEHREDSGAFLAVIVRNAARNARRRHHRARPHAPVEDHPLLDDSPSAATLIAAAEQHLAVLGCVRKLGEIQRAVVMLRVIEEVSSSEAARSLNLTPGNVAVLLHRAKEALQLCMAE
jgi:RNA polymerase sigma-70 factor, ECF subfamily